MTNDDWKARTLAAEAKLGEAVRERDRLRTLRPLDEWHEDHGDVLWWTVPIEEPPFYVGGRLDDNFPDWVTHWTPIPNPIDARPQAPAPAPLCRDRRGPFACTMPAGHGGDWHDDGLRCWPTEAPAPGGECMTCSPAITPHARTEACDYVLTNQAGALCPLCDGTTEHSHRGRQS